MKEQDRRSNSEVRVVAFEGVRRRIEPPPDLTADELHIFKDVVGSCAPSHFVEGDRPLLTVYCAALHLSRLYGEHGGNGVAQKMRPQTAKLVAILANRLRLHVA